VAVIVIRAVITVVGNVLLLKIPTVVILMLEILIET